MPECAGCGDGLAEPVRQPAEHDAATEAHHYRCPGCGRGGFEIVDPDGHQLRTGGPAFTDGRAGA